MKIKNKSFKGKFKNIFLSVFGLVFGVLIISFTYAFSNSEEFKSATEVRSKTTLSDTLWNNIINQIGDLMDSVDFITNTANSLNSTSANLLNVTNTMSSSLALLNNSLTTVSGNLATINNNITNAINTKIGILNNGKWCSASGIAIYCTNNAPVTQESDSKAGTHSGNFIPKWSSSLSQFVDSIISDLSGYIGIGNQDPQLPLDLSGEIKVGNTSILCNANIAGSMRYNSTKKIMETCDGMSWGEIQRMWGDDVSPDDFSFSSNQTGALGGEAYLSPAIFVSGINRPITASCSNCVGISQNGIYTSSSGGSVSISGVMPGDAISIKVINSTWDSTYTGTLTIGDKSADFGVRTLNPYLYTKLLMHFDSYSPFVDNSLSAHPTSNGACANIFNTTSKFGGRSAYIYCAYSSIIYVQQGGSDFDFRNTDATIDFWLNPTSLPSNSYIMGTPPGEAANNGTVWSIYQEGANIGIKNGGLVTTNGGLTAGSWYHIAIVKKANNDTYIYINGVLKGSNNITWSGGFNDLSVGAVYSFNGFPIIYIDELRIVKGLAIWTSNFTPPTSPYLNN